MSAVNVPSGIAFGVTLIPPKPVSPLRNVNVERYVPGGGSNRVLDDGEVVVEEHALMSKVQTMSGAVKRINRSRGTAVAHISVFIGMSLCF
jgi:hypothetical protein